MLVNQGPGIKLTMLSCSSLHLFYHSLQLITGFLRCLSCVYINSLGALFVAISFSLQSADYVLHGYRSLQGQEIDMNA